MSRFVNRGAAATSPNRSLLSLCRNHARKLTPLLAVSLWIPWTLACGATAQGATTADSPSSAQLEVLNQLPLATAQQPYSATIAVKGGHAPYQFTVTVGPLPQGLKLDPVSGVISGTPSTAAQYIFAVSVTDAPLHDVGMVRYRFTVNPAQGGPVSVLVQPAAVSLTSNAAQRFSAVLQGTSNTAVTWAASSGTIGPDGLFTAPTVSATTKVTITASSVADPTKQAVALATVAPANTVQPLSVTTSSLPGVDAGQPYQETLIASGGKPPYTWSATGSLPSGLSLASSGLLAGSTASVGSFAFTAKVTDSASQTAQANLNLTISNNSGNFDGPAELPRVYVQSSLSDTPAPGKTISVNAGDSIKTALAAANCGDTIELQAGAEFAGTFTLPAKPCDDQHWIVIRTSAPDSALPPEGQRMTPCYAGLSSLPNRPAYPCQTAQNVLARITENQGGISGPIVFGSGANHYRLIGLEITRPANIGPIVALMTAAQGAVIDHVIVDRCWIHGTAKDDTRRGVEMFGMIQIAVIDSYLNDFHCTSLTGACSDAQALGSGGGHTANGPYKITGNFLEAAGENILFSGMGAEYPPADIEIRKNHVFKPIQWMPGAPGFVGGSSNNPFTVKNHIEFKNGVRALIEGNIFENTWGGFSQSGFSILFTARNNYNLQRHVIDCPNCQTTDITFRYNKISHVAAGFLIANLLAQNVGAAAGGRFSIHDVVIDDMSAQNYNGGGGLAIIGNGWPQHVLNSISITHVTAFPDPNHSLLVIGNSQNNPQMWGFTFSDNVVNGGRFPIWSVGAYVNDCAAHDIPIESINLCFKDNHFSNNVLIGTSSSFPPSKWPTGNFFATDTSSVGFATYQKGNGGDYTLGSSSPYKGKASDGSDPGAHMDLLNQAIAGVE